MGSGAFLLNDGGTVDSVLFQWTLRSYELFQYSFRRPNLSLDVYGLYSHAVSPPKQQVVDLSGVGGPVYSGTIGINDNKLKYGAMLEFAAASHWSLNGRFDRVQPTSSDPEQSYTALTLQAVLRSDWRSGREIIVGYTHFFLGAHDYPDSPYSSSFKQADPDMFLISAIMSL
jgi:hypothetical protein